MRENDYAVTVTKAPFEAYEGKSPYIFISYAHADSAEVYKYLSRFYNKGYRVWYDTGIGADAEDFFKVIARHFNGSSVFVIFLSANAKASINVKNEMNLAHNRLNKLQKSPGNKPGDTFKTVVINLDNVLLEDGWELLLGTMQVTYAHDKTPDEVCEIVDRAISDDCKRQVVDKPIASPDGPWTETVVNEFKAKEERLVKLTRILGITGLLTLAAVIAATFIMLRTFGEPAPSETPVPPVAAATEAPASDALFTVDEASLAVVHTAPDEAAPQQSDANQTYIAQLGGRLYFNGPDGLYRAEADGTKAAKIFNSAAPVVFQIYDEVLYFLSEKRIYRLDGGEIAEPVFEQYTVKFYPTEKGIAAVYGERGENFGLIDYRTGLPKVLAKEFNVADFTVSGENIFFTQQDEASADTFHIYRTDLDDSYPEPVIAITGITRGTLRLIEARDNVIYFTETADGTLYRINDNGRDLLPLRVSITEEHIQSSGNVWFGFNDVLGKATLYALGEKASDVPKVFDIFDFADPETYATASFSVQGQLMYVTVKNLATEAWYLCRASARNGDLNDTESLKPLLFETICELG